MRGGFLGAGDETVGREIALRLGVALQRDKDVGQGTGEQFRVKEVVRFLKGPVLRRCNGFRFGGAFHWGGFLCCICIVRYNAIWLQAVAWDRSSMESSARKRPSGHGRVDR